MGGEYDGGVKNTLLVTGATDWLMQEELPGGTTFVDARNGLNEMICLVIPCTVIHLWLPGVGGGGGRLQWLQALDATAPPLVGEGAYRYLEKGGGQAG